MNLVARNFVFWIRTQTDQGSPSVMQHVVSVEPSSLLLHSIET